MALEKY